jgi:hypothetical protein
MSRWSGRTRSDHAIDADEVDDLQPPNSTFCHECDYYVVNCAHLGRGLFQPPPKKPPRLYKPRIDAPAATSKATDAPVWTGRAPR